jgi:hypothetical protein
MPFARWHDDEAADVLAADVLADAVDATTTRPAIAAANAAVRTPFLIPPPRFGTNDEANVPGSRRP